MPRYPVAVAADGHVRAGSLLLCITACLTATALPTGLTRLDLSRNWLPRLPERAFDTLLGLVEVDLFDTPVANPGPALQRCGALRRLVVGARCQADSALLLSSLSPPTPAGKQRRSLAGGSHCGDDGGGSGSSSMASASSMDMGDSASASSSTAASPAQSWREELALQLPWVSEVVVGSA